MPPSRGELDAAARDALRRLGLPDLYLGFTMVAVDNGFWRERFAAVPFERRLLLLPHCLRARDTCAGGYDAEGLRCAGCGKCPIAEIKDQAERLGYRVIVAEGTPAVLSAILEGRADAVLGVACLDSLEKAFDRISALGIPHMSVPLLRDGCRDTAAEFDLIRELMAERNGAATPSARTCIPLLRMAAGIFDKVRLRGILKPAMVCGAVRRGGRGRGEVLSDVERIAVDWLARGGKRFRPFITLAACAAVRNGSAMLPLSADPSAIFGPDDLRVAVAIEAMHKASLVHDDIEDGDAERYGAGTIHERYGIPRAINVGDYLIGLGYRLIGLSRGSFGDERMGEMVAVLSEAHVKLAVGQGAELALRLRPPSEWTPDTLQEIYALKTAPAFEAALRIGLLMAGDDSEFREPARSFSKYLGVGYQIMNDLEDWRAAPGRPSGRDGPGGRGDIEPALLERGAGAKGADFPAAAKAAVVCRRAEPTILSALAIAASPDSGAAGSAGTGAGDALTEERRDAIRAVYERRGVFEKAERMVAACRERASAVAEGIGHRALSELLLMIVRTVL
ncbi:MAG: polyprenyl synthetase family protein [Planctomycetota bacterium]|nr:polyprenyl synthetase family protein [Planctomycetota bacterium]